MQGHTVRIRVFTGPEGQYYVALPRTSGVIRWCLEEECWTSAPDGVPAGLPEVHLAELPAGLQEEILAAATRADALGSQFWTERN